MCRSAVPLCSTPPKYLRYCVRESREMLQHHQPPLFADRTQAGLHLADQIGAVLKGDALVLGLPRGGVQVAAAVAGRLALQLDILVVRKIGVPWDPELAIGAVTGDGVRYLNESLIQALSLSARDVEIATERELEGARQRELTLRGSAKALDTLGRELVVVDDGLATGATMIVALQSLKTRLPARLIAAAPVGSVEGCRVVRACCDELVCPYRPSRFHSVGHYYQDFEPVSEEQVKEYLAALGPSPYR